MRGRFLKSMSIALTLVMVLFASVSNAQDGASTDRQRAREILAEPAPTSGLRQGIVATYQARIRAARELDDHERELAEIQAAIAALGESEAALPFLERLTSYYSDRGEAASALEAWQVVLRIARRSGQRGTEHNALRAIVGGRAGMTDIPGATLVLRELVALHESLRSHPAWPRNQYVWQVELASAHGIYHSNAGRPAEAEASFQACLSSLRNAMGGTLRPDGPRAFFGADCSTGLIGTLLRQGKLAEAGAVAAEYRAFVDAYARISRPLMIGRTANNYARLQLEQGRIADARMTIDRATEQLAGARGGDASKILAALRRTRASIAMLEGNWREAESIHRLRAEALLKNPVGGTPATGSSWAYALLRVGRSQEALAMMREVAARNAALYDENSINYWEPRAYLGLALGTAGETAEAFRVLSEAVPKYLALSNGERSSDEGGLLRAKSIGWILDGYLRLLAEIGLSGAPAPIDVLDEAFRMADLARGSTVQRALSASASRANVSDPELAKLVRQEQDLQREVSVLADAITNLLSRGRIAEQDRIVADMRRNLARMRATQAQLSKELRSRYADYAGLLDPKPMGIAEVQRLLKPREAMVSVHVGSDRTLIWAIPAQGKPVFAVSRLNELDINERVRKLREALDPKAGVPEYDFDAAHELYRELLLPVEAGWSDAKDLVVVPHGALGSLPFSVLATAPFRPKKTEVIFEDYKGAPWLLKRVSISQLPAALSIAPLRAKGGAGRSARAFVGFGDPVFSIVAALSPSAPPATTRGIARRGLNPRAAGAEQGDMGSRADLSILQALPDTAEEIAGIATVLKADIVRDVFLQQRASETNLKSSDVSDYRVVMFATHGLVPGEMPGLYQPALALSNPAITGEKEDGFLLMEEILALKLNADWVVLSACNTASSSGEGSEAVSGLGRAFFYAGAKALLVSSWPVETVSARLLTTDVFRRQAGNPALSRSGALRAAALDLMSQRTADYSYAHPLFWAPFVIVGDGG